MSTKRTRKGVLFLLQASERTVVAWPPGNLALPFLPGVWRVLHPPHPLNLAHRPLVLALPDAGRPEALRQRMVAEAQVMSLPGVGVNEPAANTVRVIVAPTPVSGYVIHPWVNRQLFPFWQEGSLANRTHSFAHDSPPSSKLQKPSRVSCKYPYGLRCQYPSSSHHAFAAPTCAYLNKLDVLHGVSARRRSMRSTTVVLFLYDFLLASIRSRGERIYIGHFLQATAVSGILRSRTSGICIQSCCSAQTTAEVRS
jgi:hypothetical protein